MVRGLETISYKDWVKEAVMFHMRTRERMDGALLCLQGYQGQRKGADLFNVVPKLTPGIHGEKSREITSSRKKVL